RRLGLVGSWESERSPSPCRRYGSVRPSGPRRPDRLGSGKVTLLERDPSHIGGRMRTFRDREGDYCELGAMRIPENHGVTRDYVNELGLDLRRFVQNSQDTFAYIRGQKERRTAAGTSRLKALFDLTNEEKTMTADEMWEKAVYKLLKDLTAQEKADLYVPLPQTTKIRRYESMSLLDALIAAGLSQEAIEFVTAIYGVGTYLHTCLAEHLREEHDEVWVKRMDEIVGGSDGLPIAMCKKIDGHVIQGARVTGSHRVGEKYETSYVHGGEIKTISSDWVICTLPLSVLADVDLSSLTPLAERAIKRVSYDSSIKILIKAKYRFWEKHDGIYGGGSIWDRGLGHTWYPSDNEKVRDPKVTDAPAYLLAGYTWGEHSRRIDAIDTHDLQEFVFNELKRLHRKLDRGDILRCLKWSWNTHEGSAGAFAFFNPGDQIAGFDELKRGKDKFLFAGEHCSYSHSWIQGALESALDAVGLVLSKERT
ncbi:MAG: NAD(P)/FAD-dependent oxidoreductase, partial [Pseudomonadota bacterium]